MNRRQFAQTIIGAASPAPWNTGGISMPDSDDPRVSIWGPTPPGKQSGDWIAKDVRPANAKLICSAPEMYAALLAYDELDDKHANCQECDGEIQPELCAECFPYADSARCQMRAVLKKVRGK